MAGYWPSSFLFFVFCLFMDRDGVEVQKRAKKRTLPISSHRDRTSLVNKGFTIFLYLHFFFLDTAGSPERARMEPSCPPGTTRHVSQEKFPESHIINSLLTKFVRSRWRSFFASLWTSTSSRSINTQKKNLANIQPQY